MARIKMWHTITLVALLDSSPAHTQGKNKQTNKKQTENFQVRLFLIKQQEKSLTLLNIDPECHRFNILYATIRSLHITILPCAC